MSAKGIMQRARLVYLVSTLVFVVPRVFAQAPASDEGDDLDVTMRVIVDPNAKVPDEIVRKIPLPKPAQPATPGKPEDADKPDDQPKDTSKPADASKPTDKPKDTGKPADTGRPDDAGRPADDGRPDDAGRPADAGRPDDAGKPTGKPPDTGKPPGTGKPPDTGKPANTPGRPAAQAAPDIREQGRAFGQQVSDEARDRSEEARRNNKPPKGPKPKPPK